MSRSLSSAGCETATGDLRSLSTAPFRRPGYDDCIVGPLSVGAVHRLLSDRLGLTLSRPKLRRVHELSGGNPFFALELGGRFSAARSSSKRASRSRERWPRSFRTD